MWYHDGADRQSPTFYAPDSSLTFNAALAPDIEVVTGLSTYARATTNLTRVSSAQSVAPLSPKPYSLTGWVDRLSQRRQALSDPRPDTSGSGTPAVVENVYDPVVDPLGQPMPLSFQTVDAAGNPVAARTLVSLNVGFDPGFGLNQGSETPSESITVSGAVYTGEVPDSGVHQQQWNPESHPDGSHVRTLAGGCDRGRPVNPLEFSGVPDHYVGRGAGLVRLPVLAAARERRARLLSEPSGDHHGHASLSPDRTGGRRILGSADPHVGRVTQRDSVRGRRDVYRDALHHVRRRAGGRHPGGGSDCRGDPHRDSDSSSVYYVSGWRVGGRVSPLAT